MRFRPRLSTVLLTVNLAVIALPLGSIFFFRIYENQLIQETERELISQAATIAAAYQLILRRPEAQPQNQTTQQDQTEPAAQKKTKVAKASSRYPSADNLLQLSDARWSPINPGLDLAKVATLPARPDGRDPPEPPTAAALLAGRTISPIVDQAQRTTLIGVRVLDRHGTTVGGTAEIGLNFGHVEEVARAMTGRYASALRYRELENAPSELTSFSRGTGVRVFVAFPVIGDGRVNGVVYLSRTPKSILRHMYEEQDKAILALVTVLVLAISLAVLTSRTISRPVAELLSRTQRVARGETAAMATLKHPGTREMAELSDGISQMATALGDRAAYIRTLASQVSHEFKTPLTSIEGAAELLSDHHDTMTAEERQRFLETISASGVRLRALLDRLLDLARAENTLNAEVSTELGPVIRSVAAGLSDKVSVELDVDVGQSARIGEEALRIALGNLFDNAVEHGAKAVKVSARADGGQVIIVIEDDGDGITPANRDKVFENFFTTRRAEGGTGLGLGIVQALLGAHGGRIDLATSSTGAAFKITLQV
ncbi:MAG: ATP-binding protein [Pseudomonadota bacterium]